MDFQSNDGFVFHINDIPRAEQSAECKSRHADEAPATKVYFISLINYSKTADVSYASLFDFDTYDRFAKAIPRRDADP